MSQPNPSDDRKPDPLLAFFEEAPAPRPVERSGSLQRAEPPVNAEDPPAVQAGESDSELRRRLERAERQIDRTLIDITTLKSDLATLVGAVEDIKKRMSRPPARPATVVPLPPRRVPGPRSIAAIVIVLAVGAAWWGLASVVVDDLPEPPPLESGPSSVVESPPVFEAPPPPAPVVAQAAASTAPPPARDAPVRVVNYVGTLTVDAEPAGDVFVNRQSVGRAPVRLENLRAGSHLIWIEREGYRRWTRVVAVAADRVSRVSASLDPISR